MTPVRVATSKPARQTYLNTFLFMTTSTILFGLAVIAYTLFYFNYVPQIGTERIIHLQYACVRIPFPYFRDETNYDGSDGPHPYGIASLDSSLIHDQPYDISISLHMPRSPTNLAAGNFMLSMSLLSPTYNPPSTTTTPPSVLQPPLSSMILPSDILFTSRRPTLLTYTSRLVSLSERLLGLPLYILKLRRESEMLHIPMAEFAAFKKGYKNIPAYILLELQTGQEVQVYDIRVRFTARFGGMRWMMYNHRIISFAVFVGAFWFAEVVFAGLGWLLLRSFLTPTSRGLVKGEGSIKGEDGETIKTEEETDEPDLSDTPRTFPTYGRQVPLRYVPKIKDEDSEEYIMEETAIQPLVAEADDESEDFGGKAGRTDSGIGTSFSEGGDRNMSRRRSRGGRMG